MNQKAATFTVRYWPSRPVAQYGGTMVAQRSRYGATTNSIATRWSFQKAAGSSNADARHHRSSSSAVMSMAGFNVQMVPKRSVCMIDMPAVRTASPLSGNQLLRETFPGEAQTPQAASTATRNKAMACHRHMARTRKAWSARHKWPVTNSIIAVSLHPAMSGTRSSERRKYGIRRCSLLTMPTMLARCRSVSTDPRV